MCILCNEVLSKAFRPVILSLSLEAHYCQPCTKSSFSSEFLYVKNSTSIRSERLGVCVTLQEQTFYICLTQTIRSAGVDTVYDKSPSFRLSDHQNRLGLDLNMSNKS